MFFHRNLDLVLGTSLAPFGEPTWGHVGGFFGQSSAMEAPGVAQDAARRRIGAVFELRTPRRRTETIQASTLNRVRPNVGPLRSQV